MNSKKFLALVLLTVCVPALSTRGQIAQSTFDSNRDGWLVVDRTSGLFDVRGTRTPTWRSAGGNTGGFIEATDNPLTPPVDWYWHAPDKFLGDQSTAYGGRLEYDIISDLRSTPVSLKHGVILIGGGVTNFASLGRIPPANRWTNFSVDIRAGAPWTNAATSLPATEAEMRQALSALEVLDISGEFGDGGDTGGIDNVKLYPACPPSTIRVSEVEICWQSILNARYRVDYRMSVPSDPWNPLVSGLVGTGEEMCVSDRMVRGQPQRFYRVVCEDEVVEP
jgi:alkaline phosphatase D